MQIFFRHRSLATCTLLFAWLSCASCVHVSFVRDTRLEPLPVDALSSLAPGKSNLQSALDRLGPPIQAWELPDQGVALAWGCYHSFGWQFRASDSNKTGLFFDYGRETARLRGAVLFFDRDWQLTGMREGLLDELRAETRARPTEIDTD